MYILGQHERTSTFLELLRPVSISKLTAAERLEMTLRALSLLKDTQLTEVTPLQSRYLDLRYSHRLAGMDHATRDYIEGVTQTDLVAVLYDSYHSDAARFDIAVLVTTNHRLLIERLTFDKESRSRLLRAYRVSDLSEDELAELLKSDPDLVAALIQGVQRLLEREAYALQQCRDAVLELSARAKILGSRITTVEWSES